MSFIEMVTIQKGGVLQWQRTKMKKKNQNKQQNKPETGNPKLDIKLPCYIKRDFITNS